MVQAEQKLYLNSKVYPTLMEGIYQTSINTPEDPVVFLANWLKENNPNKPTVKEFSIQEPVG